MYISTRTIICNLYLYLIFNIFDVTVFNNKKTLFLTLHKVTCYDSLRSTRIVSTIKVKVRNILKIAKGLHICRIHVKPASVNMHLPTPAEKLNTVLLCTRDTNMHSTVIENAVLPRCDVCEFLIFLTY